MVPWLCRSACSRIVSEHWSFNKLRCCYGQAVGGRNIELRERLVAEVKSAMKSKDSFTATTLRSILSEIYAADKALGENVAPTAITTIIHRATIRRNESAEQFAQASRPDLADRERREAELLTAFLPPPISEDEINAIIYDTIAEQRQHADLNSRKNIGQILKRIYARVDKAGVAIDSGLVKRRVEELWSSSSKV